LAAGKHLGDAQALAITARPDRCAYLSGYVAECCLKSLWLLQTGVPAKRPPQWSSGDHALKELHDWLTTITVNLFSPNQPLTTKLVELLVMKR